MRVLRYALPCLFCGLSLAQTIVTVAGLPYSHRASIEGKLALTAPLNSLYGVLLDHVTGRLLLHDETVVSRLEPDGTLLSLAGMGRGSDGASTNGTLASGLYLATLRGMAQDATGALYLADARAGRVYRAAPDGVVTIFAGGSTNGAPALGDGGPATNASLPSPRGLVFDSQGNLDIAEAFCHCIRQVSPAGMISTLYTLPQDPGPLQYFEGLAIDAHDNLYATEYSGSAVLKIGPDGLVVRIAGTGVPGFSGDGGPATAAQLNGPSGVTLDASGNIYIADSLNNRVRRIEPGGSISTFAGNGAGGFSGDGGAAIAAQLFTPAETVIDAAGNVYISDYTNRRVRMVTPGGVISSLAGSGAQDLSPIVYPQVGDGGPALHAIFNNASSAAFSPAGELYVADMLGNRIRKIGPDGIISTVAGNGQSAYSGEGGPAVAAQIVRPITVATDASGTVYFETGDSRVLKVTSDGTLRLIAGTGTASGPFRSGGDGGPAVNATLNEAKGLAIDPMGNVYIADTSNARLRKVDTNGIITTLAGPGLLGTDYWNAVALDPQGNVYVAITHSAAGNYFSVIDRVDPNGILTAVAGNGQSCSNVSPSEFLYDGQPAAQTPLCVVVGLTFDAQGIMYIPESFYGAVLRVSPEGSISRIAGSNSAIGLGDGGSPLLASLQGGGFSPASVAFDARGNVFLPQSGANRIREVMAAPLALKLSQERADFKGSSSPGQSIQIVTNVAEPLPFAVRVNGGGSWLRINRVTGQTGDALTVSVSSADLAPGIYSANLQIVISGNAATANLPVTLTLP